MSGLAARATLILWRNALHALSALRGWRLRACRAVSLAGISHACARLQEAVYSDLRYRAHGRCASDRRYLGEAESGGYLFAANEKTKGVTVASVNIGGWWRESERRHEFASHTSTMFTGLRMPVRMHFG